jgi:hypothetical protein
MENLTHWKKNIDSKYVSGEDLVNSLKGLKPEMVVEITKFEDSETFDQQLQAKITKTGLFLKEVNGAHLYKPVILNKTNAVFLTMNFNTAFMEHWVGKPVVLFAKADKRHGQVVRFRKYIAPATITDVRALKSLEESTNIQQLVKNWEGLSADEKKLPSVIAKKEQLKTTLK